jgi:endogenous inhibitor of DNA gyrase (YacG/DUF329 family)
MPAEPTTGRREPRCPICRRPRDPQHRPFCSPRCRDQDLLNWLGGRYAIPAQESEADDDDEAAVTR